MRLLLLDRDGVINEDSDEFIKSPQEWRPIEGSLRAIARATQKGYRIIVVSNQSGLARGVFDVGHLNRIHTLMHREVARVGGRIDAIFFCPHGPGDGCGCRKPATGLLESIAQRLDTNLADAVMIGDRVSDMQAALAVKARGILIERGRSLAGQAQLESGAMVMVCGSLAEAIDMVLDAAA